MAREKLLVYSLFTLSSVLNLLSGQVTIQPVGENLKVQTSISADQGWQGCSSNLLNEAPAYIFRLYQAERPVLASCGTKRIWREVQEEKTNNNEVTFGQMEKGEYQVEVLYARTEGCQIQEKPGYRSVIYKVYRSTTFSFEQTSADKFQTEDMRDVDEKVMIFPNPNTGEFTVRYIKRSSLGQSPPPPILRFFNLLGEEVRISAYLTDQTGERIIWQVDATSLPSGTYIVSLTDQNTGAVASNKFVVVDSDY
jgi:hypothetical protein